MSTAKERAKKAAYMREYLRKNNARINAQRRARMASPEAKASKNAADAKYRANREMTPELRAAAAEKTRRYAARHPERVREMKRRYDASEAGRESKRRCEENFRTSGGRAAAEKRRAERGLSEARQQARLTYGVLKRGGRIELDKFDRWAIREAVRLARLRTRVTGFQWHVDHVVPVSKGGTSHPSNLQVVPARWNRSKSNKHSERMFGARA